jgi:type III secretion protein C
MALSIGTGAPVHAAVTIGSSGAAPFFVSTRGARLADVLSDLGANYQVPVVVSNQVDESFIGSLGSTTPDKALDHLARVYKLVWYYDGQTIYVYKAQEVVSKLIMPTWLPAGTLLAQLRATGVVDGRHCRLRAVSASNALEVYGVPVCVERVAEYAKHIDEQTLTREQNQEVMEFFPLKYATAADTQYSYRSQTVLIPGVASLLKEMTEGMKLPHQEGQESQPASAPVKPMFSADLRQNAVIVRDRKVNIPLYSTLVEKLDRKPKLVEISVAIIDVNAENIGALGVDWSASAGFAGASVSFNGDEGLGSGNFSTVIANTAGFMVRLSALEQNAQARVLSRPSVVTLDNMQAVLDRNITFYTKLVAENVAKLEAISTGSLLRVTPRISGEDDNPEIMLTLVIQDGRQANALSRQESLPQTLNSEIATHALLKAGQALLLGGFVQDEQGEGVRKIPLFGDIPLLGKLFSTTHKNHRHSVRLFLIKATPWMQP